MRPVARQSFPSKRYTIAHEMAVVIVSFPIFLFVMRFILREVETHPDKLESRAPMADLHRVVDRRGRRNRRSDQLPHLVLRGRTDPVVRHEVLTVMVIAGGVFCV